MVVGSGQLSPQNSGKNRCPEVLIQWFGGVPASGFESSTSSISQTASPRTPESTPAGAEGSDVEFSAVRDARLPAPLLPGLSPPPLSPSTEPVAFVLHQRTGSEKAVPGTSSAPPTHPACRCQYLGTEEGSDGSVNPGLSQPDRPRLAGSRVGEAGREQSAAGCCWEPRVRPGVQGPRGCCAPRGEPVAAARCRWSWEPRG